MNPLTFDLKDDRTALAAEVREAWLARAAATEGRAELLAVFMELLEAVLDKRGGEAVAVGQR